MFWQPATQNILFCPSGAGHSCGNPAVGSVQPTGRAPMALDTVL